MSSRSTLSLLLYWITNDIKCNQVWFLPVDHSIFCRIKVCHTVCPLFFQVLYFINCEWLLSCDRLVTLTNWKYNRLPIFSVPSHFLFFIWIQSIRVYYIEIRKHFMHFNVTNMAYIKYASWSWPKKKVCFLIKIIKQQ